MNSPLATSMAPGIAPYEPGAKTVHTSTSLDVLHQKMQRTFEQAERYGRAASRSPVHAPASFAWQHSLDFFSSW
jgi:hypothetical protein